MCILKAFLERMECCIYMFPSLSQGANTLMYSFQRNRLPCTCMRASSYVHRCLPSALPRKRRKEHLVLSLYPLLTGNNATVTGVSKTTNRAISSDTLEDLYWHLQTWGEFSSKSFPPVRLNMIKALIAAPDYWKWGYRADFSSWGKKKPTNL